MKTIRNQLKNPIGVRLTMCLQKESRAASTQLFMRLRKEQQIDNKQKVKQNLAENAFETVKP